MGTILQHRSTTFLFLLLAFISQGQDNYIQIHPNEVSDLKIFGSNNTVIRGTEVEIIRQGISEEVVKNIEKRYQYQLDSLGQALGEARITLDLFTRQTKQLQRQKEQALLDAATVLSEFKSLDSIENTRVYQTADSLYRIGKIDACLAIVSNLKLSREDEKNAKNRRLKARLHSINFEFKEAALNFEKAVSIFKNFENLSAAIQFFYAMGLTDKLYHYLQEADQLAQLTAEKLLVKSYLFYLNKTNNEKATAIALLDELYALVEDSDRTLNEKRSFRAAIKHEKAGVYLNVFSKQKEALDLAMEAAATYKSLAETDEQYRSNYLETCYTQTLILKYMRNYEGAYTAGKLALDEFAEQLDTLYDLRSSFHQLMGIVSKELKKYDEAIQYATMALHHMDSTYDARPSLPLLRMLAFQYYNLGNVYLFKKDFEKAITTFGQSLEQYKLILSIDSSSMENLTYLGQLTNNRGKAFELSGQTTLALNDYLLARDFFSQRETFTDKIIFDDNSVNAVQNTANLYAKTGRHYESLQYYRELIAQIGRLMPTEPAYWQEYMYAYTIKLSNSLKEVYKSRPQIGYLVESHRHLRGAKTISKGNNYLKYNEQLNEEYLRIYKELLDLLYPLTQAPFKLDSLLSRLSMRLEFEQYPEFEQDLEYAVAWYKNNASEASNSISQKRSPFFIALDERQDEVDRFEYAWWQNHAAIATLLQGNFAKALEESRTAAIHSDGTDTQALLAVLLIIQGEEKEALKLIRGIRLKKGEKQQLITALFDFLESKQLFVMNKEEQQGLLKKIK
jgi:tetratricopeptide (TPR) repeat protein